MTAPRSRSRQPKQLDAGMFQAEISSFALRLAAEGKAAKTAGYVSPGCQLPPRGPGTCPQVPEYEIPERQAA